MSAKTRARFGETLEKIRRRDASIYDNDVGFFETPSGSSDEGSSEAEDEIEAPLYLKDVTAQQVC